MVVMIDGLWRLLVLKSIHVGLLSKSGLLDCSQVIFASHHSLSSEDLIS